MKTIGDLIDGLLAEPKKTHTLYLEEVCEQTPPNDLASFRAHAISPESVATLCETIACQVDDRLKGVSTEGVYDIVREEARAFFEDVWAKVESFGVPRENVFVPVSPVDWAIASGFLQRTAEGRIELTEAGQRVASSVDEILKR